MYLSSKNVMKKYIKLFIRLIEFSLITQMQYRFNFLLSLPIHLAWTLQEIFITLLFYTMVLDIGGWNKYEYALLLGTYFIIDSLFSSILLPNLDNLAEHIRSGQLDFFLLKPIDSQFLLLTYKIDIGLIFSLLIGVVTVVISLFNIKTNISILQLIIYIILIFNGTLVFASIIFIVSSFVFFTVKIDFVHIFFLTIAQIARKPISIYPKFLSTVILYIIPIGFIAYIPSAYLLQKTNKHTYLFIPLLSFFF